MTKIDKFKPSREKKAYSYFGTICKNYLMGQIIKDQKETNRKISYEDISTNLENNENFAYYIENDSLDSERVIKHFLVELDRFIKEENLSENEIKLGHALYDIFENYGNPVDSLAEWTMASIEAELDEVQKRRDRESYLLALRAELLSTMTDEEREALGLT
jgi:hypothetical protein